MMYFYLQLSNTNNKPIINKLRIRKQYDNKQIKTPLNDKLNSIKIKLFREKYNKVLIVSKRNKNTLYHSNISFHLDVLDTLKPKSIKIML